jgi:hypothetical protein
VLVHRTFKVVDAHGHTRTIRVPRLGLNLRDAALHQQCLWLEHVISRPSIYVVYAVLVIVGLWAVLTNRTGFSRYGQPPEVQIALVVVCMMSMPVLRMQARALRSRVDSSNPFCAECGYDLSGTPITGGGCRVCSECSAAWKFSRDAEATQPTHASAAHPQQKT